MAERGHDVHILLLSYKKETAQYSREGNLHWHTISVLPWGPSPYVAKAKQLACTIQPDWLIGFSDTWYGILAYYIARTSGARSLIDAYDNYESYIPWLKPLHWLWRHALTKANVVTAAGPQLAERMSASAGADVEVVPMAADPIFAPLDRNECRRQLGLPIETILVGDPGALHPNRGIELLFSVFAKLQAIEPQVQLVLSGRLAKGLKLPPGVRWLGYRPAEDVPVILNSIDLFIVINKATAFGNYSYPAKLYEAMACGLPLVAADVPGTAWVMREHKDYLAQPGNVADFVDKVLSHLQDGRIDYQSASGWRYSVGILEVILS